MRREKNKAWRDEGLMSGSAKHPYVEGYTYRIPAIEIDHHIARVSAKLDKEYIYSIER